MTNRDHAESRGDRARRRPYRLAGALAVIAALILLVVWLTAVRGGEDPAATVETFVAKRGPLMIRVLEAGALKAKDPEVLCSSLQGRAVIISIVPEGTWVKKGDLLVELDVTKLVDHRVDHEIMTRNAEAAYIDAREAALITKSLAQSSVEAAQLKYDFAKLDLEKYLGQGGQYATDLAKAKGDIALSQQEVEKNKDYYDWSEKLAQEKYLSGTQLKADELTLRKSELNLRVAENNLQLLERYTYQRQLVQLRSDVHQSEAALERAKAKARANVAQAQAHLAAHEQEYRRNLDMLARVDDQISKGKIYAPTDGMVLYATSEGGHFHDDRKPLADGVEVWMRQELIYLTRSTSTVAEVDLHEANLQKVRVGLPVIVTVDALPGRKFVGTISRIAPLADAQSMWMNPDLKVYQTEITLAVDDPELRSGMNCRAEIIVEQHADALYVPVQSIVRVRGQPVVYVVDENGTPQERPVEIGLDDNTVARVVRGLEEGEAILLRPPRGDTPATRWAGIRGADVNDLRQVIRERLQAANAPVSTRSSENSGGPGRNGK